MRPLFAAESAQGDFDAVLCSPWSVCLHNCLFQADLKTPHVLHAEFPFDRCFNDRATNEEVFADGLEPLVRHAAEGGLGTLFMFGQTGSGKTYTMTALVWFMARLIFELAPRVTVRFLEVAGKKCLDLSTDVKEEIRLRELPAGKVLLENCSELVLDSAQQLVALHEQAALRRKTESTDANDVSSRTHLVTQIEVTWPVGGPHPPPSARRGGRLLLVDCAGSERKKDSMYHTKDRQKEGAEINASLHGLKECIRARQTGGRMPYRSNLLTRILAESFMRVDAELRVIATISPCATDLEHSLATLRAAYNLSGRPAGSVEEMKQEITKKRRPRPVPPKRWSAEQVEAWLRSLGSDFKDAAFPANLKGEALVRWPEIRFVQLLGSRRGALLFKLLRDEMAKARPAEGRNFVSRGSLRSPSSVDVQMQVERQRRLQ